MSDLIILGAGGFAREAFCWIDDRIVAGFYAPKLYEEKLMGVKVYNELTTLRGMEFLVALGDPKARAAAVLVAEAAGLVPCRPIVHWRSTVGRYVDIGVGSILCPGVVLTTNVTIGKHCLLNLNATVGHDVIIKDYVTLSPGVNISGNCVIQDFCYIGTNASVREKTHIAACSTVGMQSGVVRPIEESGIYLGVPAKRKGE